MDSIVLIKQVPDTTDVKLDPRTGNLIREGIDSIINPDDRHAIEAAVRLKGKTGKVAVISMGPPQAIDALSEAIGMGADSAVLLSDAAFAGADTWATSFTLSKAIEKIKNFDLILCGKQAIDGDTAQIGPQVADCLELPHVTYVSKIETVRKKTIVIRRQLEDGYERIQCTLPALLTVISELNEPRRPNVGRILDVCREVAPITVWNAADIGVQTREVGLEGSLTHVIKTFAPKFKRQGEMLKGDAKEVAGQLFNRLKEHKLI